MRADCAAVGEATTSFIMAPACQLVDIRPHSAADCRCYNSDESGPSASPSMIGAQFLSVDAPVNTD